MSTQPITNETKPADFHEQLGQGWAKHRNGHNEEAIEIFLGVLQEDPQQINALYGLGLAQRSKGELQFAIDSFQRCLALVNAALAANPGEDEFEMLQRVVEQRLLETRAKNS